MGEWISRMGHCVRSNLALTYFTLSSVSLSMPSFIRLYHFCRDLPVLLCSIVECLWCVCLNSVVSLYSGSPSELHYSLPIPVIAVCLGSAIDQDLVVCTCPSSHGAAASFILQSQGFVL